MPLHPLALCELLQVIWHVSAAGSWTSGVHVVGAKWRREVPPSRRLTARELTLPWAHLSVPARWRRVNQAVFAVGTLAVAGASLKIANAGSCPPGPKLVIAALLVEKPRSAGGPGMPVKLIEPPPKARNAAENRPDAIASVQRQRSALAEPAAPTLPIEPALPVIEAQTTSDSIPIIPAGTQSVGQRPAEILPKILRFAVQ